MGVTSKREGHIRLPLELSSHISGVQLEMHASKHPKLRRNSSCVDMWRRIPYRTTAVAEVVEEGQMPEISLALAVDQCLEVK